MTLLEFIGYYFVLRPLLFVRGCYIWLFTGKWPEE